jgi:hypothetical protein
MHVFFTFPSTSVMIFKQRKLMAEMRMHTKFWSENLKERDHSEDNGVDGKIILESILVI